MIGYSWLSVYRSLFDPSEPDPSEPVTPEQYFTFDDGTITDYDEVNGPSDVIIPKQIDGQDVITLSSGSFRSKGLTSVVLPETLVTIEGSWNTGAFLGNDLASVTIGNSVVTIGQQAFRSNELTYVSIPDSVETLWNHAFRNNKLTSVTIGNSVEFIGQFAFDTNQLISVTIPDNVTSIMSRAFSNNQLTSVTIGNSVESIGAWSFENNTDLATITLLPTTPPTLGSGAFNNIGSNRTFIVPQGTLGDYETATSWSELYTNHTFEEAE